MNVLFFDHLDHLDPPSESLITFHDGYTCDIIIEIFCKNNNKRCSFFADARFLAADEERGRRAFYRTRCYNKMGTSYPCSLKAI